jgi:large subunit ribosomal protein L30
MAPKTKKTMITIQQYASPIRRSADQKQHLIALGLGKMNATREIEDSPSTQGLIAKVAHMVRVISK